MLGAVPCPAREQKIKLWLPDASSGVLSEECELVSVCPNPPGAGQCTVVATVENGSAGGLGIGPGGERSLLIDVVPTLRSKRGNRTYRMTAKRRISGLVLKYLQEEGPGIAASCRPGRTVSTDVLLVLPAAGLKSSASDGADRKVPCARHAKRPDPSLAAGSHRWRQS